MGRLCYLSLVPLLIGSCIALSNEAAEPVGAAPRSPQEPSATERLEKRDSPYYYLYYPNYDVPKRAPKGFFGMRGKRQDNGYVAEGWKRAPAGFFGMRGKKGVLEEEEEPPSAEGSAGLEKRAPAGFFGLRGKKQPSRSAFFGMRGKKYPSEFRGKFVGVRGKKYDEGLLSNTIPDLADDLDLNQLMLFLTETDYQKRKSGPSGFVGMRG